MNAPCNRSSGRERENTGYPADCKLKISKKELFLYKHTTCNIWDNLMLKLTNHEFLVGDFDDSPWYIVTGSRFEL